MDDWVENKMLENWEQNWLLEKGRVFGDNIKTSSASWA